MTSTSDTHDDELHVKVVPVPYVVTASQAAKLFGRSRNWFYDLIKSKEGAPILAGARQIRNTRVFKTETIIRFIEQSR
jgi:hypothetical protein